MSDKVGYVLRQRGAGNHHCHWPGCTEKVPPARWGCRTHWYRLPKPIRDAIWRSYNPGQEISKRPSQAYLDAATAAQDWIRENFPIIEQGNLGL